MRITTIHKRLITGGAASLTLLFAACVNEPAGIIIPCARPEVVRTFPLQGATAVPGNVRVTATFNHRMNPASFAPGSVVLLLGTDTVPGTISYVPADTTVRFTPTDTLRPAMTYTVYISPAVRDTAGLAMDTAYAWNFTTAGAPGDTSGGPVPPLPPDSIPPAPLLLSPADSATGVLPLATPFTWNPAARAVTYRLQVSASPLFTTTVYDASGLTATSQLAVGLLPLSTYYWRVSASNSAGTSPWSTVWRFTTLPTLPTLPLL